VNAQQFAAAKFLGIVLVALLFLTWLRGLLRLAALAILVGLCVYGGRRLLQKLREPVD
jgi:hypothetical protein